MITSSLRPSSGQLAGVGVQRLDSTVLKQHTLVRSWVDTFLLTLNHDHDGPFCSF